MFLELEISRRNGCSNSILFICEIIAYPSFPHYLHPFRDLYTVAASSDQKTKISLMSAKSLGGFCSDEILVLNYEHKFLNHSFHVKHLGFANFLCLGIKGLWDWFYSFKYTVVQFSFFFNKKLVTFWLTANKKTCFLYSNFSIRFYKFI